MDEDQIKDKTNPGNEDAGAGNDADGNEAGKGEDQRGEKKFTQADLDKVLESRLKRAEASYEKKLQAELDKRISDYERKSKLTEAERVAEASKEKEASLAQKERELAVRENRNFAIDELREKKIPTDLVDYLATADRDETEANIDKFETAWTKAIAEAIADASRGEAPRDYSSRKPEKKGDSKKRRGTVVL